MHHASHILMHCIAFWCLINGGRAARHAVNPDILANFAKNIASVLSPAILGDIQFRTNRSILKSSLKVPTNLNDEELDSPSILDNIVDNTSNAPTYYGAQSYNNLYENSPEEFQGNPEVDESLEGSLRDEPYLRQQQPNFYRPYDFSANSDNLEVTEKPADIEPLLGNIEGSATNLYSSYHDAGFDKAAFAQGPFGPKSLAGFHGFGHYGDFHGHHHHHHHHPYGDEPADSGENNGTDHQGYGRPYGFGPHGHHPYSSFPYGGYHGNHGPFYGPYGQNGNNSSENGRNRPYGPYYDGPDFYGPPGYGHHHGHSNGNNNNNNNNNNSNRQTEEPAENGDENNSTRNGHPHHYGPPLFKPLLGAFHLHGLPSPFNLLPYDHFHGVFKGGPVVGVGHIGYPTYVGPYPIGFPFHHPYGPFFYGKKYLPPKGKPSDSGESGESTEAPAAAGELAENATPERITAGNQEVIAPASSSNRRYKISGQNGRKQISMANSASRKA